MITLRRITTDDAALLDDLVARNIDILRPWMPWAQGPLPTRDERLAMLSDWERLWDAGTERHMMIESGGEAVGVLGLVHREGDSTAEIGYWLDAGHHGRGFMTAAVRQAVDIAFASLEPLPGIDIVRIHHDRSNAASGAIPRRLGFRFVDDRPHPLDAPGEIGRQCAWAVTSRAWRLLSESPAVRIRSFAEHDRAELIGLWQSCDLVRPWNDPNTDIDRKLAHSPDGLRVAEENGVIVGTAMVGYDGHRGWVNYLAVAPENRGRGIGARLMVECEAWLAAAGCPKINLQVRPRNDAATEFYLGLDYEPVNAVDFGRRLVIDDEDSCGSGDC